MDRVKLVKKTEATDRVKLSRPRKSQTKQTKSLERVTLRRDLVKAEGTLWKAKASSKFKGCEMIGRRYHPYIKGYILYYDIGSNHNMYGSFHPDGATMIVPKQYVFTDNFEPGVFRVPILKKSNEVPKKPVDEGIERVKLNGKRNKRKIHSRVERSDRRLDG